MRRRVDVKTATVAVIGVYLVALAVVAATAPGSPPTGSVRIAASVPSGGRLPTGAIASLVVSVSVEGSGAFEPHLFVLIGPITYAWNTSGPASIAGPGTATYRLSTSCTTCAIPAGAYYRVRVYDDASRTYSFSPVMRA